MINCNDGVPWHPAGPTQSGAIEMLRDLLKYLLMWVETEGVPVQESVRQAAANALAQYSGRTDYGIIGRHIQRFLKAVEVPVLVLCGKCPPIWELSKGVKWVKAGWAAITVGRLLSYQCYSCYCHHLALLIRWSPKFHSPQRAPSSPDSCCPVCQVSPPGP